MIAVKSLTMTRDWPRPVGLDASSFQKLIDNGPRYESLLTLKAFWHRGMAAQEVRTSSTHFIISTRTVLRRKD